MHRLIISLITAVILLMMLTASAQDDTCSAHRGFWDVDEQQCIIQSALTIHIDYPLSLTAYPFADHIIESFIQNHQTRFLNYFAEGAMSFSSIPIPWSLNIWYTEYRFSDDIASIEFVISEYTGGAHPNTDFQTFTFDVARQRQISLDELFAENTIPFDIISPIAQQQISDHLGLSTITNVLINGTGYNAANYQNFVLTEDALIFLFPPYQVAGYAAGPQTVTIPWSQLDDVIASSFRRTVVG